MPSLYELTGQALELQLMLEAGEIDDDCYNDTLEGLDIETKIENICAVIRNLEAEAEMFRTEKNRLADRQKTAENSVKRLKDSLLNYMIQTNQSKVKQGTFSVRVNRSEVVNITNLIDIPDEYVIYPEPKANKSELKKALKDGEEIPGAELVTNESVVIR